jgi:hypothetical protein
MAREVATKLRPYRITIRSDREFIGFGRGPIYDACQPLSDTIPIQPELGFRLCSQLRLHRSSLHPEHRRASAIGRVGLSNPLPLRSCTVRGRIKFLGSVFT